ncbi:MAG TPA: rhodanese-like domain-containing protein [Pseudonocardia sp.]|uniref:rhodanese-like domain-containing protein n=1 Tax=Pseudonocardia sp. TaxID=60912 RepID=UPI002CFE2362|nr:rhodanese-like domain-containing protein [Pseudonocardia sp.]HTF47145.1 rhodanese-like domain-containing protein [Pseudonocardia sp.]
MSTTPTRPTPDQPLSFDEPDGVAARGTVVVLPGRGERPGIYQRLGKRLAADAYRVRVVGDATEHLAEITVQVKALLGDADRPSPAVLVGSDSGALLALRLVALGTVAVDGLILAGLPDPDRQLEVAAEAEAEVRASCPTHQKLLRDTERAVFQAGALTSERIPDALREPVDPAQVPVPVLGLHGDNDQVSPLERVHADYAGLPRVELLTVADGRHDVLNAANQRSVAASVVLWLERLKLGAELPPIVRPMQPSEQVPPADQSPRRDVLITADELRDQLQGDNPPTLLDVRWALGDPDGHRHYRDGHIPGAVYVDLDTELAAHGAPGAGRHPLPELADLQAAARRWGVRTGRPVVIYDNAGDTAAARAWWLLRWAGVPDVRLLDGALKAWLEQGFELATGEEQPPAGDVELRAGQLPVLTADRAAALAEDTGGVLLDARAGERYRGEVEPIDPRAGHIPGALSAPTADNLTADGTFRPTAELRDRFAQLNAAGSAEVGVYCGSGVTAAHEIAALAVAGIPAALYPGSWSAWSSDPDRPAATGAEPGAAPHHPEQNPASTTPSSGESP